MTAFAFAKRNIRRTPYQALAATLVMFLTFLAVSVFVFLGLGSQVILKFYESKPQAIAFFKDGTSETDVQAIQNALLKTGKITKFKYVSKEEALQIYRERNKNNPLLLELVTANILPASLEISTTTPDDLKLIAEIVKREPVVEEVVFPEDVIASLTAATRLIRIVGAAIVGFSIIFSMLIIMMIIGFKIRLKREEIETMKLLGASTWFIRMPFLLEGLIYAIIGSVMGWVATVVVLWYFEPMLAANLGEVAQSIFPIPWFIIVASFLFNFLLATILGTGAAYLAVRRYLRL